MDPLPRYGSFEFMPYSSELSSESILSKTIPTQEHSQSSIGEQPLRVRYASSWTYCGPILTPSGAHLPPSFHSWSSLTFSEPSTLLSRLLPLLSFLQTFLPSAGAHHYWLTIRATNPTHDYDTPRWHTDDNFFAQDAARRGTGEQTPTQTRHWKLAATLLGPSTLFLASSAHGRQAQSAAKHDERSKRAGHICTSVRCLGCSDAGDAVRQTLARALCGEQVMSPAQGQVAFFRIGDEEGAVHSEPRCDVDRVFVNVTPGTEEGLRALMGTWGMGFPRAWCFGVPVGFVVSDEMGVVDGEQGEGIERRGREDVEARDASVREESQNWLDRMGFRFVKMFI